MHFLVNAWVLIIHYEQNARNYECALLACWQYDGKFSVGV